MPNMDYPGPCSSCIADNCDLWEENYSKEPKRKDESKGKEKK